MAPGSRSLFSSLRDGLSSSILTSEDFLAQAAPGEFCFLEDRPIRPFLDRVESMVLYHWNRRYPADACFWTCDPAAPGVVPGWAGRNFPAHSHKKITKEVYRPMKIRTLHLIPLLALLLGAALSRLRPAPQAAPSSYSLEHVPALLRASPMWCIQDNQPGFCQEDYHHRGSFETYSSAGSCLAGAAPPMPTSVWT